MTTITQTITTLPAAPDPATMTPTQFSTAAAAYVLAQKDMVPELNTWAGQVNTVAGEVNANAIAAAADAVLAEAASDAAIAVAGADLWVSGQSYALGAAVISPIDLLAYRANTATSGTTDPSASSDWVFVGSKSGIERIARTSNTILTSANLGQFIDITSGTFSQTFDACATLGSGFFVWCYNSGAGVVTLDPNSSETINGSATLAMNSGMVALITCDGSNLFATLLPEYVGVHEVCVTTGNGYGSTNSKIRRFTTTEVSTGTAITYADSATLGATFTINENGLYSIEYFDGGTGDAGLTIYAAGVSKNSSQLSTDIEDVTASAVLLQQNGTGSTGTSFAPGICISGNFRFSAADVVRAHNGENRPDATDSRQTKFRITKVGV